MYSILKGGRINVKANGGDSAAEKEGPRASSRFPGSLWSLTGCCPLNESEKFLHALRVLGELGEVSRAAICCYELMARDGVQGAVHNDVLNCLECLTARAGDLVSSVLRVEALGVFPNEDMSCNDAVKSCKGEACKLSFGVFWLLVLESVVSLSIWGGRERGPEDH